MHIFSAKILQVVTSLNTVFIYIMTNDLFLIAGGVCSGSVI